MARNKDPAVLFYPEAYLVGTRLMNYEQKGKYMELLCLQHQQGHLSEEDMITICGERDDKIFAKFEIDQNGCYFNVRMEEESIRRANYTNALRLNGAKGGRPPTNKNQLDNQQVSRLDNQLGNQLRNRNINKNIDIDNKKIGCGEEGKKEKTALDIYIERFDRFWAVYPKKVGKGDARKAFAKIKPSEELTQKMIRAVEVAKKSVEWTRDGGQFIPYPSTWLNQARWEDELTPITATEAKPPTKASEYGDFDPEEAMKAALKRTYGG